MLLLDVELILIPLSKRMRVYHYRFRHYQINKKKEKKEIPEKRGKPVFATLISYLFRCAHKLLATVCFDGVNSYQNYYNRMKNGFIQIYRCCW